jgi:hypothetical protein
MKVFNCCFQFAEIFKKYASDLTKIEFEKFVYFEFKSSAS